MTSERSSQQTAMESASSGSQTILESRTSDGEPTVVLRLRAPRQSDSRHIQWAEDVVDNEGMGKKSSKVCCIYHRPGESESEDDSSSSESDDEPDLSRAQRAGGKRGRDKGKEKKKEEQRRPSPNAYERQPKHKSAG